MADLTLAGVISAFGSAVKLLDLIKEREASLEIKATLTELYGVIATGQQSALQNTIQQQALLEEKNQFKEELARIKRWDEEKQRYQLHPVATGYVYALKEASRGTEPPHWICTQCYQKGDKSILQTDRATEPGWAFVIRCPGCQFGFHTRSLIKPEYV